ncbi:MAG: hypothetical protein WC734_05365 [Patescibacteria group bacterium]|jgi:hypothetical protein
MSRAQAFKTFLSNIEPSDSQVGEAKTGHETLRGRLGSDDDLKALLAGDTFLAGSYRRSTAVKPIKDVDIIVPLSTDRTKTTPHQCLKDLRKVLLRYYKTAHLEDQRRSIRIDLSYVTMDIVPACAPDGPDKPLWVPDREQAQWIETNPKGHIAFVTSLNKQSDGQFVPLVKIFKWWRLFRLPEMKHPKSFFLELLVADSVDLKAEDFGTGFHAVLKAWRRKYEQHATGGTVPNVADPGLPGQLIHTGMSSSDFKTFYDELVASEEVAQAALDAEDDSAAAEEWRKIFGQEFPANEDNGAVKSAFVAVGYRLRLTARLSQRENGELKDHYPSNGRQLPKDWWIRFQVAETDVPAPYQIKWIVENHGREARDAMDRGHVRFPGTSTQWERTKYTGQHHMYCQIIKNDRVVATGRHVVNIS